MSNCKHTEGSKEIHDQKNSSNIQEKISKRLTKMQTVHHSLTQRRQLESSKVSLTKQLKVINHSLL